MIRDILWSPPPKSSLSDSATPSFVQMPYSKLLFLFPQPGFTAAILLVRSDCITPRLHHR